jgi:replicative DNA helicase
MSDADFPRPAFARGSSGRGRGGGDASGGGTSARVPPHNIQAEESLLGAMLLSRDAIASAVETVTAGDFYKPAHGHIFDAITSLFAAGEPADPVTVAEELSRSGLLDAIGGPATLVSIQAATPATTSAARYARIVEEHSLLRRLIGVAGEIAELGYDVPDDVAKAVDRAEALVFQVAQRRVTDTLSPIRDLLSESLDRLEQLYERGEAITGIPTGFVDLDELLSGMQPSNLIVVGSRPSMGKTSCALGIATHVAVHAGRPVLVFSLEMSQLEVSQRILCAEARVDSTKVRTGRLSQGDWTQISHAVGRLAEAPIFVDDNANISVMEIRAKARRLKSSTGGLGLVVIDYVQLMTGRTGAESRQVEVSEISRSLKILARELDCPVLALAQLNRQLEQRADKRPMLADLRESGCLTAETRLLRADNNAEVTLGELVASRERDVRVWSLDEQWRLVPATLTHAFPSGTKPVYRLRLASGRTVDATASHRFRTLTGWDPLGELSIGDRIAVPRTLPVPDAISVMDDDEVVLLAHLLGDGCVLPTQPVHYTSADTANLDAVRDAARRRFGIEARLVRQERWWHLYLPSPYRLTHGRRNPVMKWWAELGLNDCRSWQKFVPDPVQRLPMHQVASFLRHLWATDGSVQVRRPGRKGPRVRIYYASTSRRLVDDVQRLLLRFDIQSRVTVVPQGDHRVGYHLRLDGADHQRRFLEQIGVHGARGEAASAALAALDGVRANPNVDTIPWLVRGQIADAMKCTGITQRSLAAALGEQYCGSYMLGSEARPRSMRRSRLARIADITGDKSLERLATSDVLWDTIVEIEPLGDRDVFDATVLGTHNFVANGIIAHNSLEQDSDVVVFLYRDEVYNPETPDRGTAEVIVAKHRSGPTGKVRLAWLDRYTKFANMAKGL